MNNGKESAMIALLPMTTDWCKIDLPHMTLVYAGETKDLNPGEFNELAKDAASIAMLSNPITLQVLGKETFGNWSEKPEDMVDVFRLRPSSELLGMRNLVENWNESEHPFNPHVTIGPVGSAVEMAPVYLAFDRIMVGWGTEYLTFWLKR